LKGELQYLFSKGNIEWVFLKQYFIHIQSEWDQAAGLAYFSPLPNGIRDYNIEWL
jgi:hypothetical protein